MKVNFYIDNINLDGFDFSNVDMGNPGVGGTEFVTIKIAKLLGERIKDIVIQSPGKIQTPSNVRFERVENVEEAIKLSAMRKEILVLRMFMINYEQIVEMIKQNPNSKIMFWLHLTPTQKIISDLGRLNQVKAFVCVGNNQRIRLIDYEKQQKLVTIPHPLDRQENFLKATNSIAVCYLGALVPQKGFHQLADIWPQISLKNPLAKLYVVGSSSLYGVKERLGKYSIAEARYEKRVFKTLSPQDKSVVFLGNLNYEERVKIFKKCSIGVVNPSGATETFCLSAMELQQHGLPVVSANKFGLKDSIVNNKTGILVRNNKQLKLAIEKLLADSVLREQMSLTARSHVESKYEITKIVELWLELLKNVSSNQKIDFPPDLISIRFDGLQAYLGILNRIPRIIFKSKWPMLIELYAQIRKILFNLKASIGSKLSNYNIIGAC
jgi:glycosyltransferase involved in cell wall biosynthesis